MTQRVCSRRLPGQPAVQAHRVPPAGRQTRSRHIGGQSHGAQILATATASWRRAYVRASRRPSAAAWPRPLSVPCRRGQAGSRQDTGGGPRAVKYAARWRAAGSQVALCHPRVPGAQFDNVGDINAQRGKDLCNMLHGHGRLCSQVGRIAAGYPSFSAPLCRRPEVLATAHAMAEWWRRGASSRAGWQSGATRCSPSWPNMAMASISTIIPGNARQGRGTRVMAGPAPFLAPHCIR